MPELIDGYGRKIVKLRVSITDRCPLRCIYCNSEGISFLPREKILKLEEIIKIVKIFSRLGIKKIRITGGEPLSRKGLESLIEGIHKIGGIEDIGLTTNGQELERKAEELKKAGLNRINVSLDTLDPEKYRIITGGGILEKTLNGIREAVRAGLRPLKINAVIIRGINDDEIENLASFSLKNDFYIRFIEFMTYNFITHNGEESNRLKQRALLNTEIKDILKNTLARAIRVENRGHEELFLFNNGKAGIGFISPESAPFCSSCNKLRLTSWGELLECLYAENGLNLRDLLRNETDEEMIKNEIVNFVKAKCYSKYGRYNLNMKSIGG
ncbi:MAG: GTP 3',8-cyclase MoaA [Spirochaetes bacterium]|nr:MAG: GTP 3',8-cyclase MoaA [Spirochaetota bacterium]